MTLHFLKAPCILRLLHTTVGCAVLRRWGRSFIELFFPRCCVVCDRMLRDGESHLCLSCRIELPRTQLHQWKDNPMEQMFWGWLPIKKAAAYFYYTKSSPFHQLIYRLKYDSQPEIGVEMGHAYAAELLTSDFFDDIDLVVPVPLHPKRLKQRGYNQSEAIAQGICMATGLPLNNTAVRRTKYTDTQTHKTKGERMENVKSIFQVDHPELYANLHILIVDDVVTTGSTVGECALAFCKAENVKVSILSLAVAHQW